MELDMLIRSALSDAQWLIAKGGTDRAETLNRVPGKIGNVLKELDGGIKFVRKNKTWKNVLEEKPIEGLICLVGAADGHDFKLAAYHGTKKWHLVDVDIRVSLEKYPQYAYLYQLGAHIDKVYNEIENGFYKLNK